LDGHYRCQRGGQIHVDEAGLRTAGTVSRQHQHARQRHYCPQRTDDAPVAFEAFFEAPDGWAYELQGRLGLEPAWLERWDTLSHGERKRVQIAIALWRRPQVLAVDEPTNHLDVDARALLADALHAFRGIGVLVSHDRQLLDNLCRQCLFVEPPEVSVRPGGYTQALELAEGEAAQQRQAFEQAKAQHRKLKRELQRRKEEASRSDKRRSKRGLAKKDFDAKQQIDLARVSGKDGTAGRLVRQMEGRLAQAQHKQEGFRLQKRTQLGIWMPGERSKRDTLLSLQAGTLSLGKDRELKFPNLVMLPEDRIAVTGPNGAGKSTLINHLTTHLNVEAARLAYLPQEIDLAASQGIMQQARGLPKDELGRMMDVVGRLGSWPKRVLETDEPSPGEIRKVLLAMKVAQNPHLIIMDEPTNHLDLPAVECLEAALADCPCGLLLVSHDQRFLQRLTHKRWHLAPDPADQSRFQLEVHSQSPA